LERASATAAFSARLYNAVESPRVSDGPETWLAPAATAASTIPPALLRSFAVAETLFDAVYPRIASPSFE
jgi:hypothetical protein